MQEKNFNISITKETHNRKNGEIGILTIIQIDRLSSDGKAKPFRSFCSYEVIARSEVSDFANKTLKEYLTGRRAS